MPGTLPRQHANSLSARWSIAADNQLRTALETGSATMAPAGIVSGGLVTRTGAFSVELAAGTVAWCEGIAVELAAPVAFAPLPAAATSYLWALVQRTARDRNIATAEDTWQVVLSRTGTNTPPSAAHIPVAVIVCDGSSIVSIDQGPAGKHQRLAAAFNWSRAAIDSGNSAAVDAGWQAVVHRRLVIRGRLVVRGRLVIRE
jgi:hypothetical protein